MEPIPTPVRKAFVLLSGGLDSTTCLYVAQAEYGLVQAISVDYGQRHLKEMDSAAASCAALNAEHKILNIQGIMDGKGVMLTDTSVDIPDVSYDEITGVSPTYVPFRNGTLLSLITAQAQQYVMQEIERLKNEPYYQKKALEEGSGYYNSEFFTNQCKDLVGIYFGAHSEDAHSWAYPDCTPEFIGSMANAIYLGTYFTVRLHTPLMWLNKAGVIELGETYDVDWAKTWSCYKGEEVHCGVCPTCRSRRQGFIAAGVDDPTEYAV